MPQVFDGGQAVKKDARKCAATGTRSPRDLKQAEAPDLKQGLLDVILPGKFRDTPIRQGVGAAGTIWLPGRRGAARVATLAATIG